MAKAKFKWAKDFMVNARTSPAVFKELERRAEAIAAKAGPGHEVSSMVTRSGPRRRARVQITAESQDARKANSERQALLRALGGGGG